MAQAGRAGLCGAAMFAALGISAVVGTNQPARPLTLERVSALPPREQGLWKLYLERSARQGEADRAVLRRELQEAGLTEAIVPPGGRGIPRNCPAEWYASDEARRMADVVVSFQTPAGGWSKNLDFTAHARQKGEAFAANNLSKFLAPDDFDTPHDQKWNYVGTLDNDATNSQLQLLARVGAANAGAGERAAAWRASYLKGVEYLLAAQYPNGGWPQVWPLEGGYHDGITINDGAMTETLESLEQAASSEGDYAFVPTAVRRRAAEAVDRGIGCLMKAQIVVKGVRTVWSQQHDALTLEPASARNYEPPAMSSSESAGVLLFLMGRKNLSAEVVASVHAAVRWLQAKAITGKAYARGSEGARLVDAPGAAAIWSRFYSVESGAPVFGDRDKTIHDNVEEISRERRNGYSWYNGAAQAALDRYQEWAKTHPVR